MVSISRASVIRRTSASTQRTFAIISSADATHLNGSQSACSARKPGSGLCGLCVFADQTAQNGSPSDRRDGRGGGHGRGRVGWLLGAGLVGSVIIVVSGVLGQDGAQMSLAEDEQPVGALASG